MQKGILIGEPKKVNEEVFVEMAKLSQNNNCPKYHSLNNHNFWIKRNRDCPYCKLGSKPVHDSLVDAFNGHGDNIRVKQELAI